MGFWKCFFYFCFTGAMGFILGRLLPPRWFHPEMRGFRCLPFEKDGKLYEKLHVRRWQQLLPDMSRILPWAMPQKKLSGDYAEKLPRMLQETCIAETIHVLLCVIGLYSLKLWPGAGGVTVYVLYVVFFNLPYIVIQRYNRPRLLRLYHRVRSSEYQKETPTKPYSHSGMNLQCR